MAQLAEDEKDESKKFEFELYNSSWFTKDKNSIRRVNDSSYWRPCYGKTVIDTGSNNSNDDINTTKIKSVEWTIKIKVTSAKNIMVGVCKDSWLTDIYGCYTTANGYLKNCNGPYLYHQSSNTNYGQAINGSGTTIKMTFNAKERKLSFNIDGQDYGVAWTNMPTGKYRFALDMLTANDEVQVLSEKIEYDNHLLCALDSLKQWNGDLKLSIEAITKQQDNLPNLAVDNLLKDVQNVPDVRSKIKLFEKQLQEYKDKLDVYEKDLGKYLRPNEKNFRKWKPSDVTKWIIGLDDGIYAVYADKLFKSLTENQIGGEDLKDITKNDLFLFGVTVFKHRTALLKHFDTLVNGGESGALANDDQEDEGENETQS